MWNGFVNGEFMPLVAQDQVLSAITSCEDFIYSLRDLKLDYKRQMEDLSDAAAMERTIERALRAIEAFFKEALVSYLANCGFKQKPTEQQFADMATCFNGVLQFEQRPIRLLALLEEAEGGSEIKKVCKKQKRTHRKKKTD